MHFSIKYSGIIIFLVLAIKGLTVAMTLELATMPKF